jgi:Fe-S-cluster containining protein
MEITTKTTKEELIRKGNCAKQCGKCCTHASGIVLPNEIKRIAKHLKMSEEKFRKNFLEPHERFHTIHHRIKQRRLHPSISGSCMMLNASGDCKIHVSKPLYCKVTTCEEHAHDAVIWFDLKHFVNPEDPQSVREWADYLHHGRTIKGGELHHIVPNRRKLRWMLDFGDLQETSDEIAKRIKYELKK